ncbi:CCA tRNA nucleotidyltransferase, mitochondrial [Rhodotorula sphaerocarpa]
MPTIELTPDETRLVHLLTECANWVDQNPSRVDALRLKDDDGTWIGKERGDEPVELRIAGGWVRDKLLGRQSDDIDVSTSPDPITGLKFAMLFEQYLESIGQRDLMGRLTKIEAKPEQSKHLETATARVCNLSVDWVQQRGQEVYTIGSRIPTVAFGSPTEDAERRDLTINALFYNLRTRSIEDQTGKGLADLGFVPGLPKRIRTPLEPVKTFHDDPLRVVRAVRFAARFGTQYELDGEMEQAIKRGEIKEALRNPLKISRERVGTELDKMLLGNDPQYAYELIERLELHPLIFLYEHDKCFYGPPSLFPSPTASPLPADRSTSPPPLPDTTVAVTAATILVRLLREPSSDSDLPPLHPLLHLHAVPFPESTDAHSAPPTYPASSPATSDLPYLAHVFPSTLKRLFLCCGLLPLYDFVTVEKNKVIWVGEKVVRDGIKGPTVDIGFAKRAREGQDILRRLVKSVEGEGEVAGGDAVMRDEAHERAEIGMRLRNPAVHDGMHQRWNVSLLWSLVLDLVEAGPDLARQRKVVEAYNRFVEKVISHQLDQRAFAPTLLDGKAVNALLPFTKSSPAMPRVLDLIMRFQLAHPDATQADVERYLFEEGRQDELRRMVEEAKPAPKGKKRKDPAAQ